MWVHRRSENPSRTETGCYWKKSILSSVGTSTKFLTVADFGAPKDKLLPNYKPGSFLQAVICDAEQSKSSMQLLKYYSEDKSAVL